jgi:ABC-type transport system involved in cytochrome bd biosynthesis fused ATPase/permease subunit
MKKRILSMGTIVSVPSRTGTGTGRRALLSSHILVTEASAQALYHHHRSRADLTASESADSNVVICGRCGMGKTRVLADVLTGPCSQRRGGQDAQ